MKIKNKELFVCKQCKNKIENIYNFNEYAYKINGKLFCCYSCMQNYKKSKTNRKYNKPSFV